MNRLAQHASALAVAFVLAGTATVDAQQASIVITNGTAQTVDYYLIDAAGTAQFVYTLAPGQQVLQPTQPGLEFAFGVNGQEIASYRSTPDMQQAFTVGAATPPAAPMAPMTPMAPVAPTAPTAPTVATGPAAPVPADPIVDKPNADGYAWAFAAGIEEGVGYLTYSVPETDDTVLALQCPLSNPTVIRAEFFSGAEVPAGQQTMVGLASNGAGARMVAAMGNDQGRPVLEAARENPLWLNLNDEGQVSITIANQPAGQVDGFGASLAAGTFFSYCRWQ